VRTIERQRVLPIGRRRVPRIAAILAIYATVLGLIAAIVAAVLPPLVEQGQQLWLALPQRVDMLQTNLVAWGVLPSTVTLSELLRQAPVAGSADVVTTVLMTVWSVAGGVFGFVSILLLTFYLLVESPEILSTFVRLFRPDDRARVTAVLERVSLKVSAWLSGQLLLGLIIGVTSAIGLALLGVPYAYLLAVICGIGEMIPMVGPVLSAVPAIAVALTVSPRLALGVGVFFVVQQALENNILVPKVLGRSVGLNAVSVIVALAIGSALLGLIGAILAVPTAAVIQVLVDELVVRDEEVG
jgi:predicted PurR-regulated permease PerM